MFIWSLCPQEITISNSYLESGSTIFNPELRSISTEFRPPSTSGWMSTAAVVNAAHTGSSSGTLTKRSNSRQAMQATRNFLASPDTLVKDYVKKRWIIMALLSTEIETLVTTQYPLETTREALITILSNRDYGTALGNQN